MKKIQLPIYENTILKSSVDYMHILSIIFNQPAAFDWFAENYIQMLVGGDSLEKCPMFYNFVDNSVISNTEHYFSAVNKSCPFLEIYRDPYSIVAEREISIIEYLKEKIRKNYYVTMSIDIRNIDAYKLRLRHHLPLFYGYDEEERVFFCADYFDRHYEKISLSFEDVSQGYQMFINEKENIDNIRLGINCMKPRYVDYKIDVKKIVGLLQDYIAGDNMKFIYQYFIQNKEYHYGISVLTRNREMLQRVVNTDALELGGRVRYAHYIDFEKAMIFRIGILKEYFYIDEEKYLELKKDILENLKRSETLMLLYLKNLFTKKKLIVDEMIELIKGMEEGQKKYISSLIDILKNKVEALNP